MVKYDNKLHLRVKPSVREQLEPFMVKPGDRRRRGHGLQYALNKAAAAMNQELADKHRPLPYWETRKRGDEPRTASITSLPDAAAHAVAASLGYDNMADYMVAVASAIANGDIVVALPAPDEQQVANPEPHICPLCGGQHRRPRKKKGQPTHDHASNPDPQPASEADAG